MMRFDNGLPWGTNSKVPSAMALWLVGLGIQPVFGRPNQSTDNAIVERCHGVLNAWVEPESCPGPDVLQKRLREFTSFQRERYPINKQGQSRLERYPQLRSQPRPYHRLLDRQLWSQQAMYDYLATFRFQRKVEVNGRITLLNREYSLGKAVARQTVAVQMDPQARCWVFYYAYGQDLARRTPKDLTYQTITAMTLAYRRRGST